MKGKPATKRTPVAKTKPAGFTPLFVEVRQLIQSARRGVASVVDTFQVMTNFEIGRRIVEHEQKGKKRAAYGAELLKELSARLTEEFGRGFSVVNLSNMRRFPSSGRSGFKCFSHRLKNRACPRRKVSRQLTQRQ